MLFRSFLGIGVGQYVATTDKLCGDESIYLVEGDYSEEMGFIREKRQNYSSEEAFIL